MIIYKITNTVTGKIYIGKDKKNNPNYYGSGVKIKDAIKKYGKSSFQKDILEHCSTNVELNNREIFWIEYYNATNPEIGYNISTGGDGGDNFTNHYNKESYRSKIKLAAISSNSKLKEIHRENAKNLWKNKEYRDKVITNQKKSINDPEYKESFKKKMKEISNRPEVKYIKSRVQSGSLNSRCLGNIIVTDLQGNETIYETAVKASNALKTSAQLIRNHCKNNTTYERGLYRGWKFRFQVT
jgi:group I intron endonuclease